jgi:hypothetical protein
MTIGLMILASLAAAQDAPVIDPGLTPESVPCPQPPPCPPVEPCPDHAADDALLDSLLLLLSTETGADAAVQLGKLGDARAVPPLVHTARTRRSAVAVAASQALARYPEALEPLVDIVSDGGLAVERRSAAVESLGLMDSEPAADALVAIMVHEGLPRDVREAVLTTVRIVYPHRLDELQGEVSRRGTGWLMAGGAGALGFSMASVGYFGQADLEVLGGITGAAAGGSLGYMAGRRWPIEAGDAAFLSTTGLVGTTSGVLIGCGAGEDTACWTGGLLGEAVGFGAGAWLMERHPGTQIDSVEALVISGATGLSAGTAASWRARQDQVLIEDEWASWYESDWEKVQRASQLATGLGLAGGLAVGHAVSPHVDLSGSDIGHMTLGATWGGFSGGLLAADQSEGMSLWSGAGLGTLLGYGLATPMELGGDAVFTGYTGLGYGSMVGLGSGLLVGEYIEVGPETGESLLEGTVWVGGTAGMGLGSYLAWKNPNGIKANDLIFTGLGTGWAAWQTTGWWSYADAPDGSAGLNALVPATVGSVAALASPRIDINVGDTLSATSLGLWGLYLGFVGSALADADGDQTLMATLVASDVGLGTGILLMSPAVDASPVVVGMSDAGGVAGATMGAVVVALATGEQDPILVASLVGAGAGALGGGILGARLEGRERRHQARFLLPRPRLDLPGDWAVAPTTVSDGDIVGYGVGMQVTGW